jgi:subtilase family serine protease
MRATPDIALVADPSTGVAVYDSTPCDGYSGWMVFGGTSVATPCCAGIANLLGKNYANNPTQLAAIYAKLGNATAYRDITSGTAGAYTAKVGYDLVTGVGCPLGTGGF